MFWKAVSLVLMVVVLLLACTESSGESPPLANPAQADGSCNCQSEISVLENRIKELEQLLGVSGVPRTSYRTLINRVEELESKVSGGSSATRTWGR
jgi:hypothetical protein